MKIYIVIDYKNCFENSCFLLNIEVHLSNMHVINMRNESYMFLQRY